MINRLISGSVMAARGSSQLPASSSPPHPTPPHPTSPHLTSPRRSPRQLYPPSPASRSTRGLQSAQLPCHQRSIPLTPCTASPTPLCYRSGWLVGWLAGWLGWVGSGVLELTINRTGGGYSRFRAGSFARANLDNELSREQGRERERKRLARRGSR